jgi:hypothetical protein
VGNGYKMLLRSARTAASASATDNAQALVESLWARLKTELLEARKWPILLAWPTRQPA